MSGANPNQVNAGQPPPEVGATAEQLMLLESAGVPLGDLVAYRYPQTLEEFRAIDINNFSWHFYRYGDDPSLRRVGLAGQYGGFRKPYFQRFVVLYPEFVAETSDIEMHRMMLRKACDRAFGSSAYEPALAAHEHYYEEHCEPRLFFAWQVMSQLIDRNDQNYRDNVKHYGEDRAVWTLLSA